MKLIVGLGNPGPEYAETRHNAGFLALDFLAEHFELPPFRLAAKHKAQLSEGDIHGERVLLAKPQTFMNLSGQAVRSLVQFFKISLENLVVIYDDVAIPQGHLRLRPNGSAGGHNGMKSIIQELGTQEFPRLRLGLGTEKPIQMPLEDFVLGRMTKKEMGLMKENFEKLPPLLKTLFMEGVDNTMELFN